MGACTFTVLRTTALLCAALLPVSCHRGISGTVLMTDDSYSATVMAGPGTGLISPTGLHWSQGRLYVVDRAALAVLGGDGRVTARIDVPSSVREPHALAVDGQGNAYVSDSASGSIWELTASGGRVILAGRGREFGSCGAILVDADGWLLVSDPERHRIVRVSGTGEVSVLVGEHDGLNKPGSMTRDEAGNLYVVDDGDHTIYFVDRNHNLLRLVEARPTFSPKAVFYSRETLYIADGQDGKLYSYASTGGLKAIAVLGGDLQHVQGLTVDDRGSIYLSVHATARNSAYIIKIRRTSRT
jgi:hypothetical protein